jgi:hypothetical protein
LGSITLQAKEQTMSIQLPPPIDRYVALENSGELEALAECFALEAVALDEGRTITGRDAIREWKAANKRRYNHTVTPLAVTQDGDKTRLTAEVTGDFPGSPIALSFCFAVRDGKIVSLEIVS